MWAKLERLKTCLLKHWKFLATGFCFAQPENREKKFRQRIRDFTQHQDSSDSRHITQRANMAYMYFHDDRAFAKRLIGEHNLFFDKFRDSFDDSWYRAPIAVAPFAAEVQLYLPDHERSKRKTVNSSPYFGPDDVYYSPNLFPSFVRGTYVRQLLSKSYCDNARPYNVSNQQHELWCARAKSDLPLLRDQISQVSAFRSKLEPLMSQVYMAYPLSALYLKLGLL